MRGGRGGGEREGGKEREGGSNHGCNVPARPTPTAICEYIPAPTVQPTPYPSKSVSPRVSESRFPLEVSARSLRNSFTGLRLKRALQVMKDHGQNCITLPLVKVP